MRTICIRLSEDDVVVGCNEVMFEFIGAEVPKTVGGVVPSGGEVALLGTDVMFTRDATVLNKR